MSTNPLPPFPAGVPQPDPDNPDVSPVDPDDPASIPQKEPEWDPNEDPNEQLPRD